jgi:tripartite-type tricarboxylate transporter receptor subunit TctC
MKLPRRRFLHLAAGAVIFPVISATLIMPINYVAWSQTTKTIKNIVPFPAGGGTDILARLLADQIVRAQGVTMLIENRPGAGTVIGSEAASRASPDGNTLLFNTAALVIGPHLRKLNYDPLTSFEPVCHLVDTPVFVVVNAASPYRTLADLFDAARAKPGELTLASVGPAATLHIASEKLKRAANVNMIYVRFPGAAPTVSALLGGHVTAALAEYPVVVEQVKTGKMRALATGSRRRVDPLTDVPTVAETAYQDYEADVWYGVLAPAKTPKETISQLSGWFTAALQAPETKQKLVAQGLFPVGKCSADFGAHIRKQYDEYGRIIREANIKPE